MGNRDDRLMFFVLLVLLLLVLVVLGMRFHSPFDDFCEFV